MLRRSGIGLLVLILTFILTDLSFAGQFVAYSLKEAQRRVATQGRGEAQVSELGGITDLAGMVFDEQSQDFIIVGQANAGKPPIPLDDLVVAMRAVFIHKKTPLVSIDRTPETDSTNQQVVRYEGGIENTRIARDMLEADVVLKKLALGVLAGEVWGVRSYAGMLVQKAVEGRKAGHIASRFWFKNFSPSLARRQGVFAIMKLEVGIETEVVYAEENGAPIQELSKVKDEIGDLFAAQVKMNLQDIAANYPVLTRARPILALVSLAEGMSLLKDDADLNFWLRDYQISPIETPKQFELLKTSQEISGRPMKLTVCGGLEMNPIVLNLKRGNVSALREAVLSSRPSGNALVWSPPLMGWQIPGAESTEVEQAAPIPGKAGGFSLDAVLSPTRSGSPVGGIKPSIYQPPALKAELPKFTVADSLPSQSFSPRVGGVMLRGVAQVAGGAGARVDLSSGNFSLVVEGENARLAPAAFRKFITALWSVYYTGQDPGISIDPIERGGKKHLVRYIGSVVNNDLGRVMREADYIMKKWAVGTEKPNIPGFKDVDALSARHGLRYVGASRRFWFVPEDMRFKRGGEMLLFDDGHMTLKTEYRFQDKAAKAEPADEAFAKFFTAHYAHIAANFPVYQELFDYAKLVSLAKYLKEQGVPLQWFLLANKDLVLTEDSPGTVDALAKGSRHFEGLHIEGGVNLGFQGQYVYDQQAVQAVGQAVARSRERRPEGATRMAAAPEMAPGQPTDPVSFAVGQKNFTAVPQHSLTSGRDRRGLRYQTDLAFRQGNQPGLELVRYFNPQSQEAGEFGKGWHLLIPYRLKPAGEARRKFLNAVIPEKMALWNLISGEQEILTFSTDRYSVAGYVPEKLAKSQVVGLFLLSDSSYRLADKLGNEFWFDQAGFLTDMIFSKEHRVHLDYLRDSRDLLAYAAYRVQPADAERVDFLNVRLPRRMQVMDQGSGDSQILTFNAQGERVGYVPQDPKGKYRFLALMNDASFRLQLRDGTEIPLDRSGAFTGKGALPDHPLAKAISLGDQKITFTYTFGKTGNVLISQAHWHKGEKGAAPVCIAKYEYDDEGRLARVTGLPARTARGDNLSPIPPLAGASSGSPQ